MIISEYTMRYSVETERSEAALHSSLKIVHQNVDQKLE